MKEKNIFKFTVSDIHYGCLLAEELRAIEMMIGPFYIIKMRQCYWGNMKIWCKRKGE